jgi:hypothetical protein
MPGRLRAGRAALGRVGFVLALFAALNAPAAGGGSSGADVLANGERIYREGVLPGGAKLSALRENRTQVEGMTAACVNCHRRSGLGNVEGHYVVPPVTSKYLMRSALENTNDMDMAHVEGYHQGHVPYDDATLARALRDGIASDGRVMSDLMPRYALDGPAMTALLTYLKQLGATPPAGVTDSTLQFATIITPDADPVERAAMLEILQRFFATQAEVIAAETRPLRTSREIKYRVTRQWRLNVWDLQGPADTWQQQLTDHQRDQPVFAVLSGLGRGNWAPIHRFCEAAHVPCLFPNIDLPVVHETDFYPVYFSRGVLLEADLLASWLTADTQRRPRRLVQVFRDDDVGAAAAAQLAAALRAGGVQCIERHLPAKAGEGDLAIALADVHAGDTLALWLRASDLQHLPAPPAAVPVLFSGLMGGLDSAPLPPAWRPEAHMSYPVDLPERRVARMNFPFGWLRVQHIPISAERVQVNTYLACIVTAEALGHVLDSFVPEYLLERLEMMVSRRLANAYFPRLGLAPGQRFASKGGYVVHFDANAAPSAVPATADPRHPPGVRVVADTDWIVP